MKQMRSQSTVRSIAASATLAVLALFAAVPVAEAAPKGVVGFFGNTTVDSSPLAGSFSGIQGVAVNASGAGPADPGTIYVIDQRQNRIQRFSSTGQFERMWGRNVISTTPEVNTDLGNAFEVCTHRPDCQAGAQGSLGGELFNPRGIAVDQASGDVYVAERIGTGFGARVQKFTGDGQFVWAVGKDVIANGTPSDLGNVVTSQVCTTASDCKASAIGSQGGEFGQAGNNTAESGGGDGVAVVPSGVTPSLNAGNILVTDRGNRRVQEFTSDGTFVKAFGWDTVTDGSPSDPTSETAFQVCLVAADCKAGVAGGEVGQFGAFAPNRVAVDSTGAIYTVENSANFRLQKFTPQVGPPELAPALINPDIGDGDPALGLTGSGSTTTPFDVAVGPSDHVFVLRGFSAGQGSPPAAVTERRVVELTDTGAFEETHGALSGLSRATDLAVNTSTETLYMTNEASGASALEGVYVLGPPSPPPTVSLAVGGVGVHTAQLNGHVNPNGPGSAIGIRTRYHFEYREVGSSTWIALSADRDAGSGFSTVPVTEALTGLKAGTAYEAKLVASRPFSGFGVVETAPEVFSTPPARPDIDSVSVSDRGVSWATLNAGINPNGEATSYQFEYGTTAAYGTTVPVPAGNAGSGTVSQIFSQAIAGLEPSTTYHYRVTGTNANGSNTSTDRVFTTLPAMPSPPGSRAFELVSPPDKIGGSGLGDWYLGVSSHGQAGVPAFVGDRFASQSYNGGSLVDGAFSYGSDWALGERTPTGWLNKPAFNRPGGVGTSEFAKVVGIGPMSDDFSLMAVAAGSPGQISIFEEQAAAWVNAGGVSKVKAPALREWESGRWEITAPVAPDQLNISTTSSSPNVDIAVAAGGGYALLSGQLRGVAGLGDPTGVAFSGDPKDFAASDGRNGNVYVDDVTAGLSDSFPGNGLRSLVNICTDGTEVPFIDSDDKISGAACSDDPLAGRGGWLLSPRGASVINAGRAPGHISDDGSRVFFMSPDHTNTDNHPACLVSVTVGTKCPPQVYVRQRNSDGTVTVRWISRSEVAGQESGLLASAVFEGATPDGDKVFFRTASPLTADDPNGGTPIAGGVVTGKANSSSTDLFMYDFPDAPGADIGDGDLTRISAGPTGTSDANVSTDSISSRTTSLRAFGSNGSRVYFTTAAPLAGVAGPGDGTVTTAGGSTGQTATRNLYLYDANQDAQSKWRFIAQLPATTALGNCAAKGGDASGFPGLATGGGVPGVQVVLNNCVRAVEDGSFIKFLTDGRLTADDPDSVTGDVYGYNAIADELVRISRPQRGASGASYQCVTNSAGGGLGTRCHGDLMISAIKTVDPSDGSVFFESASRLVPEDVNDVFDVYQWRDGVLSLVSTGAAGAEDALYRGNDRTGTNVYISTRDRLSWQDHDAVLDVYTARLRSDGIPEPPEPPVCGVLADTCRGVGTPPITVPSPQTGGPAGVGNADQGQRLRLTVAGLSPRARRAAAHNGLLRVVVRTSGAGRLTAVAKGRIGKRKRRVASKTVEVGAAGKTTVKLRLSRAARRHLGSGRVLRLSVRVSAPGALPRSMSVRLPGDKS